jgi:hypothetical protein
MMTNEYIEAHLKKTEDDLLLSADMSPTDSGISPSKEFDCKFITVMSQTVSWIIDEMR